MGEAWSTQVHLRPHGQLILTSVNGLLVLYFPVIFFIADPKPETVASAEEHAIRCGDGVGAAHKLQPPDALEEPPEPIKKQHWRCEYLL